MFCICEVLLLCIFRMEVKTQVRTETVITDNMMENSGLPDLHNSDVLVMVTEANLSRDCFCLQIHSLRGQYVREGRKLHAYNTNICFLQV